MGSRDTAQISGLVFPDLPQGPWISNQPTQQHATLYWSELSKCCLEVKRNLPLVSASAPTLWLCTRCPRLVGPSDHEHQGRWGRGKDSSSTDTEHVLTERAQSMHFCPSTQVGILGNLRR